MTEKRIEEIFTEQLSGLKPALRDWEIKAIKAIAAEARNEAIDEMRDAAKKVAVAYCEIADIEVDIDAEAARLKEQG